MTTGRTMVSALIAGVTVLLSAVDTRQGVCSVDSVLVTGSLLLIAIDFMARRYEMALLAHWMPSPSPH